MGADRCRPQNFCAKNKKDGGRTFGEGSRLSCIILTHAHFDHVGSLKKLAEEWNVPVYAHHLEMPYLTGKSDYPPPDPTVGGHYAVDVCCISRQHRVNK